jgi:hypothetical protein
MTDALPATRSELLALHAAARRRRDSAKLGGPDYRAACEEISAIEVQIARIENGGESAGTTPGKGGG